MLSAASTMTRTRRKTAACSRKVANALGSCAGSFGMGSRMLKRRLRTRHARSRKCETSREKLGSAKECFRMKGGASLGSTTPPRLRSSHRRSMASTRSHSCASAVDLPHPSTPVSTSACGGPSERTCSSSAAASSALCTARMPPGLSTCRGRPGASNDDAAMSFAEDSSSSSRGNASCWAASVAPSLSSSLIDV